MWWERAVRLWWVPLAGATALILVMLATFPNPANGALGGVFVLAFYGGYLYCERLREQGVSQGLLFPLRRPERSRRFP